eukprot:10568776-Ditylum_brightwellii.AAC.1
MTNKVENKSAITRCRSTKCDREATRHCAAAAIELFAMEVVLPSLLASGVQEEGCGKEKERKTSPSHNNCEEDSSNKGRQHRAFVATLLALREVMTLNADSIFFHRD